MTKHIYFAEGITTVGGRKFYGECVSDDIIKAIQMFRNHEDRMSVHLIERREQVSADKNTGIVFVRKF